MDMENPVPASLRDRTDEEKERITRFISALNQAMVVNGYSQRRLAAAMGVESGTFTKYIKGSTDPLRVGCGIQAALAATLGVTLDSLISYYCSGAYLNPVNAEAVESWIRSEAGQEDLPELLQALMEAGDRWLRGSRDSARAKSALCPYPWPREVVQGLRLPEPALDRLGITEEDLAALEETGEVSEALVEGFSLLLRASVDDVREAFRDRQPLG